MTQPTQRLSPIEPRRLYRQIATILRDSIDAGRFPAGSLLPPERDLAEQLGVSRTSVREALIALDKLLRLNPTNDEALVLHKKLRPQ